MTNTNIRDMKIRSGKVSERLYKFLLHSREYKTIKPDTPFRVFLDDNNDFIALEACDISLGFTSFDHKLVELVKTKNVLNDVEFVDIFNVVQRFYLYDYADC